MVVNSGKVQVKPRAFRNLPKQGLATVQKAILVIAVLLKRLRKVINSYWQTSCVRADMVRVLEVMNQFVPQDNKRIAVVVPATGRKRKQHEM